MRILFFIAILGFQGCTHLRSLSTTSVPKNRTNKVRAEASRTIILGFNFDNDYVEDMSLKLANQCPGGKIRGLLTKHQTTNYFLFFVWKSQVISEGYCIKDNRRARKGKRKKRKKGRHTSSEEETELEDGDE